MLLRNVTILLGFFLCLAQNFYAQNYYYSPEGQTTLEISTEKILIKFQPNLSSIGQDQILAQQSNYLNLATKINLPSPEVSIIELQNVSNENDVNTLLQNLKSNSSVAYVGYFLNHPDGSKHGVTDQLLLRVSNDAQVAAIDFIYSEFDGIVSHTQNQFDPYLFEIKVDKDHNALEVANKMQESGIFDYAEPDFLKILKKLNTNDPNVDDQWSLQNNGQNTAQYGGVVGADMKVFDAWTISTGGTNIKVAIIDEGVDLNHPDLAANILPGFDATGQGSGGASSGDDAHGTACAGIVAAVGNNNIGGAGVAYNCKIIPVRIGYSNGNSWVTNTSWIANGMNWAWQTGNADVLSNSWGGGSASFSINAAIDGAISNGRNGLGAPVVFAAGNDNGAVSYPASYEPTIAVVAMSMCNQRKNPNSCDGEYWWGSNYGNGADVAAPGVKIFTTDISGGNGYSGGDYTTSFNGTSSACPNAAGVMALILSNNNGLSATEARFALESTTDKVGGFNYNNTAAQPNGTWTSQLGYGRINAMAALGGPPQTQTNDAGIFSINSPTGMYCYNSVVPEVVLKNYGTNTLTSVSINYNLDGGTNAIFDWTGSLAPNATTNISLPNISFQNGSHTFTSSTSNPNGQQDANPSNDSNSNSFAANENNLTLTLVFDSNAAQTSWDIKNANGTVVFSGNNYGGFPNGGTYSEDICLGNGCFDLTIYDAGGNGICCTQGNGSYQLMDNSSNQILASGGQFNNLETTIFCLPNNNTQPLTLNIAGGNNVTCFGGNDGTAAVSANGGTGNYAYLWSNGATDAVAANLSAGSYSVSVSDGISSVSTTILISQPDEILLNISATNSNGNNNGTATASAAGGVPGFNFIWNNGATTNAIQNLSPGVYTVTVTDQVGCSASESVVISNFSNASLSIDLISQINVSCFGGADGELEIQANGGTGNYSYEWNTGESTSTISNLISGNYSVTATDGTLSGVANFTISQPPILAVQISKTDANGGSNGTATADPHGGTPNYNFAWSNGAISATIINLAPGIYTVTVTDQNDCWISESVEIFDGTLPSDYCESMGNESSREWIQFVKMQAISNFSGNNGGYADFTSHIAELELNSQHDVTLAPGFSGAAYEESWTVWIDFNQDKDFDDAGEKVFSAGPTSEVVTGNIQIPTHALVGLTRMRISMKWKEAAEPCEIFDFGEVEDYSIFIIPNSGSSTCQEAKINFSSFEDDWDIWNDDGDDCRRSIDDQSFANSGAFCIRLRDNTESSSMTTKSLGLENFENITVKFSCITENMSASTDDLLLQISRDGGQSFETVAQWKYGIDFLNNERFEDAVTVDGYFSNQMKIRFKCDATDDDDRMYLDDIAISGCRNNPNNDFITPTAGTQPTATSMAPSSIPLFDFVKVFPNPTNEILNVSFFTIEELSAELTITNMVGKTVFSQNLALEKDKHQYSINVSNFDAGIYFVNIFGKNESVIQKFVIEND